jgi:hypothetical protein
MLMTLGRAKELINSKKTLTIAGDEKLLRGLLKGNWIGGTIPYFMDVNGGEFTKDKLFVTEIEEPASLSSVKWYNEYELESIPNDSPENGFSIVIIPAGSNVHLSYAKNAPNYPNIFLKPIIGWISGIDLKDLGKISAKVINGNDMTLSDSKAVAMHFSLPPGKMASIGIINLFKQGQGDTIAFDEVGFSATDCKINGKRQNLAEYILNKKIDTKLPIVANYSGTMVNVSFQSVNEKEKRVDFYAPVFPGVDYRIAEPVDNYVKQFTSLIPKGSIKSGFSCNCILNYLYSELEGKKTGDLIGPMTFGEIAYQLLNQTLVYLEILDV